MSNDSFPGPDLSSCKYVVFFHYVIYCYSSCRIKFFKIINRISGDSKELNISARLFKANNEQIPQTSPFYP